MFSKEKGEGSKSEDILLVNISPANPKQKVKPKAPQTERTWSDFLDKFRSKSCIRGSAELIVNPIQNGKKPPPPPQPVFPL